MKLVPYGVRLYPRVVVVCRNRSWYLCVIENKSREERFRVNPHHFVRAETSSGRALRRIPYAVSLLVFRHGPVYRVAATEVKG